MKRTLVCLALLCALASPAWAAGVRVDLNGVISWDANLEVDLAGYKIYLTRQPGQYQAPIDVGNVTGYTLAQAGVTQYGQWYVAATAYDTFGNESPKSAEVPFDLADLTAPKPPSGLKVGPPVN